jgi:serine/threonine protein kinase
MLGLADGLKALHAENIRHGDLKPQNILHFKKNDDDTNRSEGEGTLVIADVGASKFHRDVTNMRNVATNTTSTTASYEAPEAESDRREGVPRRRRYDMWSLGCMFLEFTIWLVYSYNAVRRFRGRRTSKEDLKMAGWTFFTHNIQGALEIHSGVFEAIRILREDERCKGGTALEDLVLLIEKDLLQIDVQQRAEAPELYEKLERIVRAAERTPTYLFNEIESPPATPGFFRSRKDSNSESTISSSTPNARRDRSPTPMAENSPKEAAHISSGA